MCKGTNFSWHRQIYKYILSFTAFSRFCFVVIGRENKFSRLQIIFLRTENCLTLRNVILIQRFSGKDHQFFFHKKKRRDFDSSNIICTFARS